jgi:tetratricopeptide (TPR) repeat protein
MSTPQPDPSVVGVYLRDVQATTINISGVTVQNILPAQRPPLWVNVPRLPPRFVGRDALVDQLVELLQSGSPGVSVHGLPGAGKSALAVVLAHHPELRTHFSDGVLWAGLGPTPDVMSLLAAWGDALGVNVTDKPTPELRSRAVANAIGQQKLLLVIDDAWQIEPAQHLRCGGPNCAHLLTSRDLGLARAFAGDRQAAFVVPELPDKLACDLLRAIAPEAWAADPAQAAQLAATLGGLPLALELVGAFLAAPERSLFAELADAAVTEMAEPAHRLALASVRLGTVDGRAVTLAETIALSLDYLSDAAVTAFYTLGAFAPKPAGFDLAAALAVSQANAAVLATLVARSLVEQAGPETLALHQVVADVARQELPPEAAARHRDHYLARAAAHPEDWQAIEGLYSQVQWAWQREAVEGADGESVLAFVEALRIYQARRGLWQDRLAWCEHALEPARAAGSTEAIAHLLSYIGSVYAALGDEAQALERYNEALPVYRQLLDRKGEAATLNNIGGVYSVLGDKQQALACYNQALPLRREVGDRRGEATTLNSIGRVYAALGDQAEALAHYKQALPLSRQVDDKGGEATALTNIGAVYATMGDPMQALDYFRQALPLMQQVGDKVGEAATLNNIGRAYAAQNDQTQPLDYYNQALLLWREVGDKTGEAATLNSMAAIGQRQGQAERSVELLVQAVRLAREAGAAQDEADYLYNLALAYQALQTREHAVECLTRSIALLEQHQLPRDREGHTPAEHRQLLAELSGPEASPGG